jgi:phage terminase Nu1 subunit (DNA packaging protein)
MTQSACAKKLGYTRQYIGKLKKQGKITVDDKGMVSLKQVRTVIANLTEPGRDPQREAAARQRQIPGESEAKEWDESSYYQHFRGQKKKGVNDKIVQLAEQERAARIAKEELQTQLAEIELAEKRRELISLEEVEEVNDRIAGELRSALLSFPSKLAPRLEGLKPAKIKHELENEINDILKGLLQMGEGLSE